MADLIESCTNNFGETPRSFLGKELNEYVHIQKPAWLVSLPDDSLNAIFEHQEQLLKEGIIVWGHIIQANAQLFEDGDLDHPAEVVYSLENRFAFDHNILPEIANRLFELKGTKPDSEDLSGIADYLTNEQIRVFGLPVPEAICPEAPCRIATLIISRKHLPGRKLQTNLFPLLVHPREPHVVMVLPQHYWPIDFVEWWREDMEKKEIVPEDSTAESILELGHPFEQLLVHFDTEDSAINYYSHYVKRTYPDLSETNDAVRCSVTWKRFYNRKRRNILDYIIRHYMPSSGWKDLSVQTEHRIDRTQLKKIRKRISWGRSGRIGALFFAFISGSIFFALAKLIHLARTEFSDDPQFLYILIIALAIAAVCFVGTLALIPNFKRLSQPKILDHISRRYFLVDSIQLSE